MCLEVFRCFGRGRGDGAHSGTPQSIGHPTVRGVEVLAQNGRRGDALAVLVDSENTAIHDGWKDEFSDFGGVQGSRRAKQNGAGEVRGVAIACVG